MRRYISALPPDTPSEMAPPPSISEVSIDGLISDCLTALYREVKNIMVLSSKGKLDPATARDLRDHLKVLFEIRDRESSLLRGLTSDQIQEIVDKYADNKRSTSEGNT
jgi:hypothetical protein